VPSKVQPSHLITIKVSKVDIDSIKADFVALVNDSGATNDQTAKAVYQSVQEEARQDVLASKDATTDQSGAKAELDMEQVVASKRQKTAYEQ